MLDVNLALSLENTNLCHLNPSLLVLQTNDTSLSEHLSSELDSIQAKPRANMLNRV